MTCLSANPKAGVTVADVANQVGQNKIAINFTWTLITGFLVMFMQAGFAMVEAGSMPREERQPHLHDELHGVRLRLVRILADRVRHTNGRCSRQRQPGRSAAAVRRARDEHLRSRPGASSAQKGMFLSGSTYDVGVMVIFLFEMVFMDTALTIVTGACAERWKFLTFCVSSVLMGAFTYPIFGNWAWGGGWLSQLGANLGLGKGYCDFAGSGVVHAVGGITALAVALIIGPRIGKFNRDGSSNAIIGHDISAVLIGCFILAFGWFGFNPGSTLGASAAGCLRIGSIAVNTMLAGCTGTFGAMIYMWAIEGQAGCVHERQRPARRAGRHHRA